MSKIASDIHEAFKGQGLIDTVTVNKNTDHHGEDATDVLVYLYDGRWVGGRFTNNPHKGFGGVEFAGPKDIPGLMIAKVISVLKGKAE